MSAEKFNMKVEQGATYQFVGNVTNPDNSAFDLSGWSARMQIRVDRSSTDVLADVTSYITINNPPAGQLTLVIPADVTEDYTWLSAVYDLEVYSGSTVHRVFEGYVRVSREVTR